jgi:hypothetical protein
MATCPRGNMPTLQTESGHRTKRLYETHDRRERRHHRADVAIMVGSLLTIIAVMSAAALFAWNLSTGDELSAKAQAEYASLSY